MISFLLHFAGTIAIVLVFLYVYTTLFEASIIDPNRHGWYSFWMVVTILISLATVVWLWV